MLLTFPLKLPWESLNPLDSATEKTKVHRRMPPRSMMISEVPASGVLSFDPYGHFSSFQFVKFQTTKTHKTKQTRNTQKHILRPPDLSPPGAAERRGPRARLRAGRRAGSVRIKRAARLVAGAGHRVTPASTLRLVFKSSLWQNGPSPSVLRTSEGHSVVRISKWACAKTPLT